MQNNSRLRKKKIYFDKVSKKFSFFFKNIVIFIPKIYVFVFRNRIFIKKPILWFFNKNRSNLRKNREYRRDVNTRVKASNKGLLRVVYYDTVIKNFFYYEYKNKIFIPNKPNYRINRILIPLNYEFLMTRDSSVGFTRFDKSIQFIRSNHEKMMVRWYELRNPPKKIEPIRIKKWFKNKNLIFKHKRFLFFKLFRYVLNRTVKKNNSNFSHQKTKKFLVPKFKYLIEKYIKNYYMLKNKHLYKIFKTANKKILTYFGFFNTILMFEGRLDVILHRLHFSPNLILSRNWVEKGFVSVNFFIIKRPQTLLRIFDIVNFTKDLDFYFLHRFKKIFYKQLFFKKFFKRYFGELNSYFWFNYPWKNKVDGNLFLSNYAEVSYMSRIFIIYRFFSHKDFNFPTHMYYNRRPTFKDFLPRKKMLKGTRILRFINFV